MNVPYPCIHLTTGKHLLEFQYLLAIMRKATMNIRVRIVISKIKTILKKNTTQRPHLYVACVCVCVHHVHRYAS